MQFNNLHDTLQVKNVQSFFKYGDIWWHHLEYLKLKIKQTAAYNTLVSLDNIQSGSP